MTQRVSNIRNGVMGPVTAHVGAACTRLLFRFFRLMPQRRKIVFMSRQGFRPLDLRFLEPELEAVFPRHRVVWATVPKCGALDFMTAIRQLWHAATAELCVVDGYVPAVCLCDGLHRAVCVQMWHAMGAIKKFGWQSVDTASGRGVDAAQTLRMHRAYDLIIAGMPGSVNVLAEAFGYAPDRVEALGLPRVDYLLHRRKLVETSRIEELDLPPVLQDALAARAQGRKVILYAPTFRRGRGADEPWLFRAVTDLRSQLSERDVLLLVARHPLQQAQEAGSGDEDSTVYLSGVSAISALCCVDAVITDYSAIAFEAWLAGKPVSFFVPDIHDYRVSPGLNIDPLREFPDVAYVDACSVALFVMNELGLETRASDAEDVSRDKRTSFERFMDSYAEGFSSGSARGIVQRARQLLDERVCVEQKAKSRFQRNLREAGEYEEQFN